MPGLPIKSRRLKTLRWWLSGSRNGVGAAELAKFLLSPSNARRSAAVIDKIETEGAFRLVHLKGFERALYYPAEMPLSTLHQFISEIFFPANWHFYEVPPVVVGPDDIVADCGASEGLFTLSVAGRCAECHVIEPHPRFVECLESTFRGQKNVVIHPVALGAENGASRIAGHRLFADGEAIEAQVRTIDSFFYECGKRLTFIKADLEGADLAAMRGALNTIRECRPKLAITVYHEAAHAEKISELIHSAVPGYKVRKRGIYAQTGCPVMLHAWSDERS